MQRTKLVVCYVYPWDSFFPYFVSDVDEVEVLDNVYRKRMITDDKHQSSTVGSGKRYI